MRLSMWILADWLCAYRPEIMIERGERTLRNVRLLPTSGQLSRSTVYLDSDESGNVLCLHDHDMLVLHTSDIDQVLSDILDAFEHYNDWTAELHDAVQNGCSTHDLLEKAAAETECILAITDPTYYKLDFAGDLSITEGRDAMREALFAPLMPLDVIMRINALPGIRSRDQRTYVLDVYELGMVNAISNLFVDDVHAGWLISSSADSSYTQGALDLQDAFAEILSSCMKAQLQGAAAAGRTAVFTDVLSGLDLDEADAYKRLATLGWQKDDEKLVYFIRQIDQQRNPQHVVGRSLEQIDHSSVAVDFEGDLLFFVIASARSIKQLETEMRTTLAMCGCAAGRSPFFQNFFDARAQAGAARIAAGNATKIGEIIAFQDVRLPYALSLIRDNAVASVVHQAIETLAAYDVGHDTDLEHTLRVFLDAN